ncbi:hypothetical protein [Spirosoma sp.]|uniref:hypothetical protein n=1 Tax=Spirosoma sp. TaxID=1899569 RepID=UPI00260B4B57|nr:hypothetical protein [Spirosoma sp.]MCX6217699.1 hypothetical protein [Spirosoma sp.]
MGKTTTLTPEKEAERQRFLDFLGPKPDLTEISEKTGILRQTLYYITKGTTLPTVDIHRDMAKAYKNYDLTYQILGIRQEPKPVDAQLRGIQNEVEKLKIENEFLRQQRDQLSCDKANYWKLLENLHEGDRDFSAVSSQTTDTLFPMPKIAMPASIDEINFVSAYTLRGEKKPVTAGGWRSGMVDVLDAVEV